MSKYHTTEETATYLRISISTLYKYVHHKKIPFHKLGNRVIFIFEELDDWIRVQTEANMLKAN
jgi:excisionase family DNA binding protein